MTPLPSSPNPPRHHALPPPSPSLIRSLITITSIDKFFRRTQSLKRNNAHHKPLPQNILNSFSSNRRFRFKKSSVLLLSIYRSISPPRVRVSSVNIKPLKSSHTISLWGVGCWDGGGVGVIESTRPPESLKAFSNELELLVSRFTSSLGCGCDRLKRTGWKCDRYDFISAFRP